MRKIWRRDYHFKCAVREWVTLSLLPCGAYLCKCCLAVSRLLKYKMKDLGVLYYEAYIVD